MGMKGGGKLLGWVLRGNATCFALLLCPTFLSSKRVFQIITPRIRYTRMKALIAQVGSHKEAR